MARAAILDARLGSSTLTQTGFDATLAVAATEVVHPWHLLRFAVVTVLLALSPAFAIPPAPKMVAR